VTAQPPSLFPPIALRPHPHLYEINTWAWLEELSARLGRFIKLADVPDSEWDILAQRGFNIIWLMGVWQRSAEARRIALLPANTGSYARALPGWKPQDVVGSPYSVAQYTPDPRIGAWDDLDRVREKLRARGMAIFLDFVGNHTALDHPWVREHPEFYVQGTPSDFETDPASFFRVETAKGTFFVALGRDPYFPPWTDTAQLNHFNPGLRAALINRLGIIAAHCDGIRCDMAMLQLSDIFAKVWRHLLGDTKLPEKEFWAEAHAAVPNLILFAEAYWGTEERLMNLGFEFAYGKNMYDAARDQNVGDVRVGLGMPVAYLNRLARFLENHDEPRAAVTFGEQRLPAAGTLMSTVPGMRFYQQGELEGRKIQLPVALRVAAPEPTNPAILNFFEKILRVTNEDVFHHGQWNLLPVTPAGGDTTSENLIAYEWRTDTAWKMIVVNLSGVTAQGLIRLRDRVSFTKVCVFYDQLNDVRYPRQGQELSDTGLFVRLDAFHAHMFDVTIA
jgi:hypothetical protein